MIELKTKGTAFNIERNIVAKIVSGNESSLSCYSKEVNDTIWLTREENINSKLIGVANLSNLSHLEIGDIVLINPNGSIHTLYRISSTNNSLFVTDRCNSNCLMCSQPPKNFDDLGYYFDVNCRLIQLIPKTTLELGITGGEPTLLGDRFVHMLNLITENLPETDIHILTNGRSFAWKNIPERLSSIGNRNVVYGIPLYSDFYQTHDFIVQAQGAFNQTVLGLHNMARYDHRIELRVVLHQQTYRSLPSLAKYIFKNLPFAEHIAFMGLEYTGYTPFNSDILWMEPSDYSIELEEAVFYLDSMGMNVSIYNLQLCLISPKLWKYSKNSISDWKREYLEECESCSLLNECGGVFATSKRHSKKIKAFK